MTGRELTPGAHRLGLDGVRDGLLWLPPSYQRDRPVALAVMFHGAGGDAAQAIRLLAGGGASDPGIAVLAPESRGVTWDFDLAAGDDLGFVQQALSHAFELVAVEEGSVVTGGFSDGASYALSLGLSEGELFSHIVAFSPGFMAPAAQRGKPRIFVSHGIADTVLPIDRCSRPIVASLRGAGYDVEYEEFDGGHVVPADIVTRARRWLDVGCG